MKKAELTKKQFALLSTCTTIVSFFAGLAIKSYSDQRRRARLIRYIQESDAQTPFVSGELRSAVLAP